MLGSLYKDTIKKCARQLIHELLNKINRKNIFSIEILNLFVANQRQWRSPVPFLTLCCLSFRNAAEWHGVLMFMLHSSA